MQSKKQIFSYYRDVAYFENIDAAAVSFAMGVHAILDFRMDDYMAGSDSSHGVLEQYIDEFCRVYSSDKCMND